MRTESTSLCTRLWETVQNKLLEQMHPVEFIPDGASQAFIRCPELAVKLFGKGEIVRIIRCWQAEPGCQYERPIMYRVSVSKLDW